MKIFRVRFLENIGPNREAHNERIKLFATSLHAAGIASLVGGLLSQLFDPTRRFDPIFAAAGTVM